MNRPQHLHRRQTRGRAFGSEVRLVGRSGGRNRYGEWERRSEADEIIRCSSWPADSKDAYARLLAGQDAIRLVSMRIFSFDGHAPDVRVDGNADVIQWRSRSGDPWERYRACGKQDYGGQVVVYAMREDRQP